ncbi:MAG: DUF3147 family protein [Nitrospinae bacterium]|nr:DUF3147 family protein [Nitrospinota bacterium]
MGFLVFKILVSAVVIGLLSELAKRLPVLSGLLTAMPLTTLLVLLWLYVEGKDSRHLSDFSVSVFWGIFPTLFFFLGMIYGFKKEMGFWVSLGLGFSVWLVSAMMHIRLLQK